MRRICSEKSDLVANIGKLKDWFKERGYPEDLVNKEIIIIIIIIIIINTLFEIGKIYIALPKIYTLIYTS